MKKLFLSILCTAFISLFLHSSKGISQENFVNSINFTIDLSKMGASLPPKLQKTANKKFNEFNYCIGMPVYNALYPALKKVAQKRPKSLISDEIVELGIQIIDKNPNCTYELNQVTSIYTKHTKLSSEESEYAVKHMLVLLWLSIFESKYQE